MLNAGMILSIMITILDMSKEGQKWLTFKKQRN